jgi:hypothetical protein
MHKNGKWQWIEEGRVLVDCSILDELAKVYKRKVLDLITLCYNKVVVFDFDGTLVDFKYDDKHLLPCKDDEINQWFETNNFYDKARLIKTMGFLIDVLFPIDASDAYILTVSQPNVVNPKSARIKEILPSIHQENVFHVLSPNDKMAALKEIHEKHGKDIVFIEDTAQTLLIAEETFDFVTGYHISSLLP